ncbi:PmeII family type II restriction endonuclease [Maridesulfovibrio sp.]|uniref:PmeII family type II restriction endonuclease n=1 Tax=Maridesulfovibrio sp. TaxID=2795000 RepID=UPI002A18974D|nr:PmeII family type II restriction endonuclease [Maridesulfovibrio sp.]
MARGHRGLPRPMPMTLRKSDILSQLGTVDGSQESRDRILAMENDFRARIDIHLDALPQNNATLQKFNTSPYVLLMHAKQRGYSRISDIENDLLPAKQFSSMETSAGRMVEQVALPIYGWECVESEMHSVNSALDGKKNDGETLKLVTLKSGPRCLNDEMSENFADAIINNYSEWANDGDASKIDFTYGVLYGTKKISNKKDWHILRNINEKNSDSMTISPDQRWDCQFNDGNVEVDVSVRVGLDWWHHLGGEFCFVEVFTALIRACILPGEIDDREYAYIISDLGSIVSTETIPQDYNVAILQRSQIPWLFLMAKHFCDVLE